MWGTYCRLHVHVLAADIEVIRAARGKLQKRARTARRFREQRHAFYREMLRLHHEQQALVREYRL